ncbi:lanthionine synthetase C family protein [Larkinella sp. VNQ87]|uniref:lanthionine synthetase C family protein n=1 Tax=Larkinella sp. VNQ87 TaxID=3400921 RepID=UPI003C0B5D6F
MNTLLPHPTSEITGLFDRVYRHIRQLPTDGNVSLLGGQMGYALLEAYAQQQLGETDNTRLWERISTSLAAIQQGELMHSFANGMAGVAWGFLHLDNQGLLQDDELDAQDIVADLDEPLFDLSMELILENEYDYLHGGLGAVLYFLERQPSTTRTYYLEHLVKALSDTAIRFPNGDITWPFDDFGRRTANQPPLYNPGLSHGTASIVCLLCLLYEQGLARPQCDELIRGTLQWMWNNRNRSGQTVFPTVVQEPRQDQDSRLGWCYGDLGIAQAFWQAGRTLGNAWWQLIAQETMLRAADRRDLRDCHIYDAGICHGAAGITHLFRRFAQRMPHPVLTETADYWMRQTLRYATPAPNEDVFQVYSLESGQFESNLGLLEGECSVGLVLLAELGVPSHWDRFLLLS